MIIYLQMLAAPLLPLLCCLLHLAAPYSTGYLPASSAPQPGYHPPKTGYLPASSGYPAPQPSYHAPQPSYTAPKPGYPAPQPGYHPASSLQAEYHSPPCSEYYHAQFPRCSAPR